MENAINYATLFMQALDAQIAQQATSGWMERNAGQVIYNGGKEIKIPKITVDGLADYSREDGYTRGAVGLDYETMAMTMDRGKQFLLDSMDINESNFVVNASTVMSEFQRLKVIPEIDVYRYSKIAALAISKGKASGGYTPVVDDVLTKLKTDIAAVQDIIGDVPLVITMSRTVKNTLDMSKEITRKLEVDTFTSGQYNTKVSIIDDCPIVPVPSARLKTAYVFNDGKTTGQEAGGFTPDASAKSINWIICAQNVPIAVSKTDNMKIFAPEQVQSHDGYLMDYRKYHDLWIPDNKFDALFVNVKEALA
ncbi:MAG: hypothetical protein LKE46_00185 [Clostridium sp.]|jgi:hypothetical protein|uniref:hypothetical protein n=1 Tax=Clostridium sp. TaxID=1506 RepID=UPI0025C6A504|nr:hypothetical protein [Clostridium sp.]MCH3962685.1 hypothetical protein [Clostridium sp.]MCI2201070.1 hypothetical protein [Clostridium sp.]